MKYPTLFCWQRPRCSQPCGGRDGLFSQFLGGKARLAAGTRRPRHVSLLPRLAMKLSGVTDIGLHLAIAGAANGGVGPGVSPDDGARRRTQSGCRRAAALGAARSRARQGRLSKDPAVTLELLKLDAVVGVTGIFDEQGTHHVDGHPVRAVSFHRRRLVCARHRSSARRLGQSRSQRRRHHCARAASRVGRRSCSAPMSPRCERF